MNFKCIHAVLAVMFEDYFEELRRRELVLSNLVLKSEFVPEFVQSSRNSQ